MEPPAGKPSRAKLQLSNEFGVELLSRCVWEPQGSLEIFLLSL